MEYIENTIARRWLKGIRKVFSMGSFIQYF